MRVLISIISRNFYLYCRRRCVFHDLFIVENEGRENIEVASRVEIPFIIYTVIYPIYP